MLRVESVREDRIPKYGELRDAWNEVLQARAEAEDQEEALSEISDSEAWMEQLEKLNGLRMKCRKKEEIFVDLSLKRKSCILPRYTRKGADDAN